ncbi:MAG: bifunctional hydroxymethylpyrimidine kinase/phosphomethylpyrimidine kinase, partial [Candidatus Neomarinimicrobiota bacterium]
MKELVLVIGGSDSSGGAGIQADIKTITAQGAYASSIITSITSQNTLGVQDIFDLPKNVISSQIDSVISDLDIEVVKIGMMNNIDVIEYIQKTFVNKKLVID